MNRQPDQQPSTPPASAAVAQSRGAVPPERLPPAEIPLPGEGVTYQIGPRVARAQWTQPYERKQSDPIYRPLRIYAIDPSVSRLEGAVALVNVPYEPLDPGPIGAVFAVDSYDEVRRCRYRAADFDDPFVLMGSGRKPSPSDVGFHQQMVYAVASLVYDAFKVALGRSVAWPFERSDTSRARLRLKPYAMGERNAYYNPQTGEIAFGYFTTEKATTTVPPNGFVFTCLSHDIIAHEVTHALLDGLRAHFVVPSGPDVLAFHEAFADLVAVFQHFTFEAVVGAAIQASRGALQEARLLTDLAREFAGASGFGSALRTVAGEGAVRYEAAGDEPHRLGSVLATAVFEAFRTVFERKVARYVRLATSGTGVLPEGQMPADLQTVLAHEAGKLAHQFLTMCIRAIDYCPPIDLEFGEFLRAVITADYDLVPDDPHAYREAWVQAFGRGGIFPRDVPNLSEDALLWRPPRRSIPAVAAISFAEQRFNGDPGRPVDADELRRQAVAIGQMVSQPELVSEFGLARAGHPDLKGDEVNVPVVESVRSSRRIGPDGQIAFDVVAEVVQKRQARHGGGVFDFMGGATIIFDPRGEIRYAIVKSITNNERLERQRDFIDSPIGRNFWELRDGRCEPRAMSFRILHRCRGQGEGSMKLGTDDKHAEGEGGPQERDLGPITWIVVHGPGSTPRGTPVLVNRALSEIVTGQPRAIRAGIYRFSLTVDGQQYSDIRECPRGLVRRNPGRIDVITPA